jgi:5-methyltetrahydropteroyltriglutamate--homocysteine methyltransferase
MRTSDERILTTHTGSLPRSEDLTALMYEHQEGKREVGTFEGLISDAVKETVGQQVRAGVDVVSDGEQGKVGFNNYIRDRLSGFGGEGEVWVFNDLASTPDIAAAQYESEAGQHITPFACIDEIAYVGHEDVTRDITNLQAALHDCPATDAFLPAASPGAIAGHFKDEHYGSYEKYLYACAEAMKVEYEMIAGSGLNLQLDCPDIPTANPAHGRFWTHRVVDEMGFVPFIELQLDALDHALADIPSDQVRLHLCWGNYLGPHNLDAPLADLIAPVLRSRPKALSFEGANPRHEYEWEVFRSVDLPDDKVIIPGVIDTLTPFVEHPRTVAQRLRRFADLVGRERVMAGTDCGFGTFVGFGAVPPEVVYMKLAAMADGARIASEELW